jgi:hypothetical protein
MGSFKTKSNEFAGIKVHNNDYPQDRTAFSQISTVSG